LPKNKMEYRDVSLWALEVHGTQGASYTLFRTHPDRNMVEEYMGTCSGVGMKNVDKEGTLSYQPARARWNATCRRFPNTIYLLTMANSTAAASQCC
jgi:hypothetical protein